MAPKSDARERLLRAAHKAFLAQGFHKVTAQSIYKECKLSQGTFSHFFPGGLPQIGGLLLPNLHENMWGDVLAGFNTPHVGNVSEVLWRAQKRLAEWIEGDRQRARLYFELLDGLPPCAAAEVVFRLCKADGLRLEAWWRARAGKGVFQPPAGLIHAGLFGQVLVAGRNWAFGRSTEGPIGLLPIFGALPSLSLAGKMKGRKSGRTTGGVDDLFGS